MKNLLEELMLELLKAYSPTGKEFNAINKYVDIVRSLGTGEVIIDEVGNALFTYGEGSKWLLLAGHIDTVPGELPVSYDGNIFRGRGAVDAKGPLVAMTVGAVEAFNKLNTRDVKVTVAALVGEEGRSHGARALIRKNLKPNAIVIGEPSGCDGVVIGYRGSIKLNIKCYGSGGHSSNPELGISAVEELIKSWIRIKESLRTNNQVSVGINYIHGGEPFSVIPKECEGMIDLRIPIGLRTEDVKTRINELLSEKCTYELIDETPPIKVGVNAPIVRALVRSIIKNGLKPSPVIKSGTSDMNLLSSLTENIVSFGPGKSELSHSDYEEISIKELELGASIIRDTILEYFKIAHQ
ncbi:MAG: N-acetyl-lysine deacetylase [Sulfolobales archaeon]